MEQLDSEGENILVKTADGRTEEFYLDNYGQERSKIQSGIGLSIYKGSCIYENEDSTKTLEVEAHLYGPSNDPRGFTLTDTVLSFNYIN